jgi:hypothetical protein
MRTDTCLSLTVWANWIQGPVTYQWLGITFHSKRALLLFAAFVVSGVVSVLFLLFHWGFGRKK